MVTLYHWDLPLASAEQRGGWLNRETAYAFADYAEVVAGRLGDRMDWWITHNEPWVRRLPGLWHWRPRAGHPRFACCGRWLAHHPLCCRMGWRCRACVPIARTAQVGITLNL